MTITNPVASPRSGEFLPAHRMNGRHHVFEQFLNSFYETENRRQDVLTTLLLEVSRLRTVVEALTGGISQGDADARYLNESSNLSDVDSVATSRTNLGLGTGDDVTFDSLTITAGEKVAWSARSVLKSPGDGTLVLLNNAESGFTALHFGGSAISNPAIKRNGAVLEIKDATDAGFLDMKLGDIEIDGDLNHDGSNAGFFDVAPAAQRAHEADASIAHSLAGADTVDRANLETAMDALGAKVNYLLGTDEHFGFMATS